MKSKLLFSFAFLFFLNTPKAQIHYTDEEIKNKYDHETMMLQQDGAERNGTLIRFNYLFPSRNLRAEIEKNGGKETNKVYKDYKKTIGIYWLISILGIIAIIITGSFLIGATALAAARTAALIYFLVVIAFVALVTFFGKKAFAQLARSLWLYNRDVLLKKS